MIGVERALAGLEGVFESVGASPGMLTPRIFAAVDGRNDVPQLLAIQQEPGFLGLMLLLDGAPAVIRTKPLPKDDWAVVERELGLTMGFAARTFELDGDVAVVESVEDSKLAERLRTWVETADGLSALESDAPLSSRLAGTAVRDRAGDVRLDPLVSAVSGGLR
jgi:hypothetical protein